MPMPRPILSNDPDFLWLGLFMFYALGIFFINKGIEIRHLGTTVFGWCLVMMGVYYSIKTYWAIRNGPRK